MFLAIALNSSRTRPSSLTTSPCSPCGTSSFSPTWSPPCLSVGIASISALEYAMSLDKKIFLASPERRPGGQDPASGRDQLPSKDHRTGPPTFCCSGFRRDGQGPDRRATATGDRINRVPRAHEDFFMVEIEELAETTPVQSAGEPRPWSARSTDHLSRPTPG